MNIWHPFTQAAIDPAPIHIDHAAGAVLYTRDGAIGVGFKAKPDFRAWAVRRG